MENRRIFEHVDVEFTYDDLVTETTDNGRRYVIDKENKLPSITTVLQILTRAAIAAWRKRVGEEEANKIMRQASGRGTDVHKIIEDYIDNVEDFDAGYFPHIIDNFMDLKPIIDERIGKIYAQEQPLYSTHLGVAGRVDCVAEFDGKLSIIDFKTSRKRKTRSKCYNYFMQEAGYAVMWEERTGMPITQLVTIMAVDHEDPIVFVEQRDEWIGKLQETIEQYNQENPK
jgi:hypothetical protein